MESFVPILFEEPSNGRSDSRAPNKTGAPNGAPAMTATGAVSGTGVEHRDGTAGLRPAGDVVAHRDRAFLAVGDGPHPVGIDAAGSEESANRLRAARAERDVV